MFTNIPEVKLGIVAVSRDCFPPQSLWQKAKFFPSRPGGHSNHLIRHSMHSREEFFTQGESLSLCRKYQQV